MCAIRKERDDNGHPTLRISRPNTIRRLLIEPCDPPDWTPAQKAILSQKEFGFDSAAPKEELEKIPFDFFYEFVCNEPAAEGIKCRALTGKMAQAYRDWKWRYGDEWETKFHERFERDTIGRFDTHFFVGTMHGHPERG